MIDYSLEELNGKNLLIAIAHVRDDYERDGKKPGASKWSVVEKYRNQLRADVVAKWCEITGHEDWCFWWTTDGVCQMWERWRKSGYKFEDIDKYAVDAAERVLDAAAAIEKARDDLNDAVENAMHRNGTNATCSRG